MTKKAQNKKEKTAPVETKKEEAIAVLPPESTVEIRYNTDILLEKILEACGDIKKSVDALAERFGGGY